jgi:uncharacterized protein (DUF2141 family)
MKGHTAALALLAALIATPALADEGCEGVRAAGSSKLTVQVSGVRSARGEVAITIYPDNKRRFLARNGKVARVRLPAGTSVRTCFWLPPGSYAAATYHDADGNRDFDRNMVGLPAEGFGFSNNPETKYGLPSLSSVRFRLPPGEGAIAVQMRYLR